MPTYIKGRPLGRERRNETSTLLRFVDPPFHDRIEIVTRDFKRSFDIWSRWLRDRSSVKIDFYNFESFFFFRNNISDCISLRDLFIFFFFFPLSRNYKIFLLYSSSRTVWLDTFKTQVRGVKYTFVRKSEENRGWIIIFLNLLNCYLRVKDTFNIFFSFVERILELLRYTSVFLLNLLNSYANF